MEPRFSVEYAPSKKLYREFGYLHTKRTRAWVVILVCVIILMAINAASTAMNGRLEIKYLIPTVIFYLYWLFADLYTGAISYSAANKATRGNPVHLVFSENELSSETLTSSSKIAYPSFINGFESENLFALYNSKLTAFLVPKAGFTEGTADGFREFISQKIGPVRRVSASKKRRIWGIVLGLGFILAMVGSVFVYRWRNDRLVAYENGAYSIRLPAAFEQVEDEDYTFSAYLKKGVYVIAFPESKQMFIDGGITGIDTLEDYAELFKDVNSIRDCSTSTLENGALCLTYTAEFEDVTIYHCCVLQEKDDTFWVTDLYCTARAEKKYAPRFLDWAVTIQIAD